MRTKIYQINSKRDVNRVKFEGLDLLERYQGSSAVDPSIYDEVFNAEIDETDLEAIYQRFNTVGHPLHRGHSLSVSDVVVNDNGAFFCDSIGFQPLPVRWITWNELPRRRIPLPHILSERSDSPKRRERMSSGRSVTLRLPRRMETTMRNTNSESSISMAKRSRRITKRPSPI